MNNHVLCSREIEEIWFQNDMTLIETCFNAIDRMKDEICRLRWTNEAEQLLDSNKIRDFIEEFMIDKEITDFNMYCESSVEYHESDYKLSEDEW